MDELKKYDTGLVYNTNNHPELETGMYLGLFHGRNTPEEELDGWGFNGPIIGPLKYVHTTYQTHVRVCPIGESDPFDIQFNDEMFEYDGKFYGDFTVYYHEKKID